MIKSYPGNCFYKVKPHHLPGTVGILKWFLIRQYLHDDHHDKNLFQIIH